MGGILKEGGLDLKREIGGGGGQEERESLNAKPAARDGGVRGDVEEESLDLVGIEEQN